MLFELTLLLAIRAYPDGQETQAAAHVQAAQVAEQHDDFATAVREYEQAVRELPRSAELESNLGVALYFHREFERAVTVLKTAQALKPELFAPHLFLGLSYFRLSNPDAAALQLEKAVARNAQDPLARTWLGYTYVAQARYSDALAQFENAAKLKPQDVDLWYAIGQCYLELGKRATTRLLALAPDGGRVWQLAAEQYLLQGNNAKALELFQGAYARRLNSAELRQQIADLGGHSPAPLSGARGSTAEEDALFRTAHDAEQKARSAFAHVAAIDSGSYRAHQIQADAFLAQDRWKDAREEYEKVAEQKPDLPGIHASIGECLLHEGQADAALKQYQQELQLQPRSAQANVDVARLLVLAGRDDEARKLLEGALQLDRPPGEAYKLLGKVEVRQQLYRQAETHLTRYLASRKDDSNAYYLLAQAYRALGDRAKANDAVARYRQYSQDEQERSSARRALDRLRGQEPDAADGSLKP